MIPIYGKNQYGRAHTIYLDTDTMRVYRNDHQNFNYTKYWLAFFPAIIFLRMLGEVSLPDIFLVKSAFVIVIIPISTFLGRVVHRKSISKNLREIYPTKDMLENYIARGKHLMRKELILAGIIFFISVAFCFLYIIFNWFIGLIFSFMSFTVLGMLSNIVSMKGWKLYKYGLSEQDHDLWRRSVKG